MVLFWGSKVKVTRRINAHTVNAQQYLPNWKAYEVQTWYTHGARRFISATSTVTSKVKVARSRDASDKCWPISRERNVLVTPKLVVRYPLPTPRATIKGQDHVVNNTSFRTTIAFYSHLLGGDTSTIMLPPYFIIIRYSLDGDTDKSNMAWVRTV